MQLSVFGLGYVGCVSAACFAQAGHEVVGVDVHQTKVDIINSGKSPIVEPEIAELIATAVAQGRLRAIADTTEAVLSTDVSLICVGTPGQHNGSLDLTHIKRVCRQLGEALEKKGRYHVVAMRSTMLPGTLHDVVIPALEVYSGKRAGKDFGIAINPEFLREGTSIADFHRPPFTLIGSDHEEATAALSRLYAHIDAPLVVVGVREAEMVKYACNAFHATKVAFANEIGNLCKQLGIDSHRVMDVFCRDTKLNLSPYYLKPGFAFGGSCLPKDLRALTYKARTLDVETPLLQSLLPSNRMQIERAVQMVLASGKKNVGVLGMSFKAGTDDLRESPMVTLIETLLGKGLRLHIYDRDVELARLFGANKEYIEREIPHISSLLRPSLDDVLAASEVLVVGKREPAYREAIDKADAACLVIDLVRLGETTPERKGYQGICW
ncbi:MAG TPA: UDP-glucose/GDP-mannose dehydrogenase family protein [Polyangia bacterium]|jgi:GDP-mannose 6-dehydrogenase|nr:UDP-glucose/GDP-mannose dehydrogenase family protein [Polyangia bacterium]